MNRLSKLASYFVARLSEGSTWAGLAAFSLAVEAALHNHAGLLGAITAGVIAVLIPDKKSA